MYDFPLFNWIFRFLSSSLFCFFCYPTGLLGRSRSSAWQPKCQPPYSRYGHVHARSTVPRSARAQLSRVDLADKRYELMHTSSYSLTGNWSVTQRSFIARHTSFRHYCAIPFDVFKCMLSKEAYHSSLNDLTRVCIPWIYRGFEILDGLLVWWNWIKNLERK